MSNEKQAILSGDFKTISGSARSKYGNEIPEVIAVALINKQPIGCSLTRTYIEEIWPKGMQKRGTTWKYGWDEFFGGLAAAIELLADGLPSELVAEISGTPAEKRWLQMRAPYQRFALVVDSKAHTQRALVEVSDRNPQKPVENGITWYIHGPTFSGRSHTLLLALMADGALDDVEGPVAATGELHVGDQGLVAPIEHLIEKASAWWDKYEDGLLITAPLGELGGRSWAKLTTRGNKSWLVGASLAEIKAKLSVPHRKLFAWDGSELEPGQILEPAFASLDNELPKGPLNDVFLDAMWAAHTDTARRGVVIFGRPGSGKSVLSEQLEQRFLRGALGALGFSVRRKSKELAQAIREGGATSWAEVLAVKEPEKGDLFRTLEMTNRLIPIVDGLDEIDAESYKAISKWLADGAGLWIATSRPIEHGNVVLPSAWEVELDDLDNHQVGEYLKNLGREDLDRPLTRSSSLKGDNPATALARTPLHLSLLAKAVERGQDPTKIGPNELYRRVFDALLVNATSTGRLEQRYADCVRELREDLVGELAIEWLESESGIIEHQRLRTILKKIEPKYDSRVELRRALEFGHLLVREGAGWSFAHRTLAEWAAAGALRQRVKRSLDAKQKAVSKKLTRQQRAQIECEVLQPYVKAQLLPNYGQWKNLLRFYAPLVLEPLFLLDRFVGSLHVHKAQTPTKFRRGPFSPEELDFKNIKAATATEVLESWQFVFELLTLCNWTRESDARHAWAIAVRRWILFRGHALDMNRHDAAEKNGVLTDFAHRVARHLPESVDGLVELAALNAEQKAKLTADPLLLLPLIPAAKAACLDVKLRMGDRAQQRRILEWYQRHGITAPHDVLEELLRVLPVELRKLEDESVDTDSNVIIPSRLHLEPLERFESLVWTQCVDAGLELPEDLIYSRFDFWPGHLQEVLRRWFWEPPTLENSADRHRDPIRLRLNVLARLLCDASILAGKDECENRPDNTRLGALRRQLRELLANPERKVVDAIVGELWERLDPAEGGRYEILIGLANPCDAPSQIPISQLLSRFNDSSRARWSENQRLVLQEMLYSLRGETLFQAIQVLSERSDTSIRLALLRALERVPEDEVFRRRVLRYLDGPSSCDGLPRRAPNVGRLDEFPLNVRAFWNVGEWKSELLLLLQSASGSEAKKLIEIAIREKMREVLLIVEGYLDSDERNKRLMIGAVAALAEPGTDDNVGRKALEMALRGESARWSYDSFTDEKELRKRLARFFNADHLDVLAEGQASACRHPELAAAVKKLGDEAVEYLIARYRAYRKSNAPAGTPKCASGQHRGEDFLAETILACIEARTIKVDELVDILFELVPGDMRQTYSTPGPLGSDFDEPGDQNWVTEQKNTAVIEAAGELISTHLNAHPDAWPELRRLLAHPSETLQLIAFEVCTQRAEPYEIAELAKEALEGHLSKTQTEWEGNLGGLRIAVCQSGVGSIDVDFPRTTENLQMAVWQQLTPAHLNLLRKLSVHEQPDLRRLSAHWAGKMGGLKDTEFLRALLSDPHPHVVEEALRALMVLQPTNVDEMLRYASRKQWIMDHDNTVLALLKPLPEKHRNENPLAKKVEQGRKQISLTTLRILLSDATKRLTIDEEDQKRKKTIFTGFPCIVEQIVGSFEVPLESETLVLLRSWLDHRSPQVRSVARRILSDFRVLSDDAIEAALSSKLPSEVVSGAESAIRADRTQYLDRSFEVFRVALLETREAEDYPILGIEPPREGEFVWLSSLIGQAGCLQERLLKALKDAPVAWYEFVRLLENRFIQDFNEELWGPNDGALVNDVSKILEHWGIEGARLALNLMEHKQSYVWQFIEVAKNVALDNPSFLAELQMRAQGGSERAIYSLNEVEREFFERDLPGLAARVRDEVFPIKWDYSSVGTEQK